MWSVAVLVAMVTVSEVRAHGYLQMPPARNSRWRFGYEMEHNFNDMGLNCGGASNQWEKQQGRCGLCGDPFQGPRLHEAGQRYASENRSTVYCYTIGAKIDITARITAYHKGHFDFRLCVNNDLTTDPGQDCVNNGLKLKVTGTNQDIYDISSVEQEFYSFQLDVPANIQCEQCILRWRYTAGNSWGCDADGTCGQGHGVKQEQFINCADISILPDCSHTTTRDPLLTVSTPRVTRWTGTSRGPPPSTKKPCPQSEFDADSKCVAIGKFVDVPGMTEWCRKSCSDTIAPLCPDAQCDCSPV